MLNDNSIGQRIAFLRKEKDYTQEQMSMLLNITPQAVSKWEKGNALPDTSLLPLLAKVLGVSIDKLLVLANTSMLLDILMAQKKVRDKKQ